MKKILLLTLIATTCAISGAFASATNDNIITYKDLRNMRVADTTPCASKILAEALIEKGPKESVSDESVDYSNDAGSYYEDTSSNDAYAESDIDDVIAETEAIENELSEMSEESTVRQWVELIFADPEILTRILECPEITSAEENEIIKFTPVKYSFPDDTRELTIYYETQPKVLRQKLLLATKRGVSSNDPNPLIDENTDSVWVNTIPAWYGIAVVQSGKLSHFVGPGKNNVVSAKYIEDNIDSLYPDTDGCTDKGANAYDHYSINRAVTKTVDYKSQKGEDDPNDYYVAGDTNLQWITWLEVTVDVILTIFTFGGWAALTATTKVARAAKALHGLSKSMRVARQTKHVKTYIKVTRRAAKLNKELKTAKRAKDLNRVKQLKEQLTNAKKTMKGLERSSKYGKDVRKYKKQAKTFRELSAYRNSLRLTRVARRGNVLVRGARAFKALKSIYSGGRLIRRGSKLGRAATLSGKIKGFLFQSTMRHVGQIGKVGSTAGLAYGAIKFVGDMYDWTSTSSSDYTNGIDFKPFLLLSADDIPEQENVVNHGMWLMWMGDSVNQSDDDAAYLQAMDFAAKFYEELSEHQNHTNSPCNVDIYVVRPIIRNPGTPHQELYLLFMNDIPWTTNE